MELLDLTLDTPAENLALDEALLETAESAGRPSEVLRLWEPSQSMVVVGRSSRVSAEVNQDQCRCRGIPILRRSSGGASVVAGPGCLMYSVVLSYELRPVLRMIDRAHCFVLQTLADSLNGLLDGVQVRGTSDLTLGDRKFSGNSLRCKRTHLLYHGTLLYEFSLDLIEACLGTPSRVPDYRKGRTHSEFVTNIEVNVDRLRDAIRAGWNVDDEAASWPSELTAQLADEKYSCDDWNLKL